MPSCCILPNLWDYANDPKIAVNAFVSDIFDINVTVVQKVHKIILICVDINRSGIEIIPAEFMRIRFGKRMVNRPKAAPFQYLSYGIIEHKGVRIWFFKEGVIVFIMDQQRLTVFMGVNKQVCRL